jgi:hypothetical protein
MPSPLVRGTDHPGHRFKGLSSRPETKERSD